MTITFHLLLLLFYFRGLKHCENKDIVFQCLTAFLEIDCKQSAEQGIVEARTLGYLAGLLPFAAKDDTLRELLRLAGISNVDLDSIDFGGSLSGLFDILEIPDNSTALLLISLLVTLLNASENESERFFLYSLAGGCCYLCPRSICTCIRVFAS